MTDTKTCLACTGQFCLHDAPGAPDFCPGEALSEETIQKVKALYEEEENKRVSVISAQVEADFYLKYTRVEEVIEFARRMGYRKLGIATCVGLIRESRTLAKILRKNGFTVVGAACKVGTFYKSSIGAEPKNPDGPGLIMCNPIMQAELLNSWNTDLNIVMGLCVGHDSLFYKYSDALVTTLVAKDRVLAHNTVTALYQAEGYYNKLLK